MTSTDIENRARANGADCFSEQAVNHPDASIWMFYADMRRKLLAQAKKELRSEARS
jgi:hypothetical protein